MSILKKPTESRKENVMIRNTVMLNGDTLVAISIH